MFDLGTNTMNATFDQRLDALGNPLKRTASSQAMRDRERLTESSSKMVFVLVGLPGRGKSFVSVKLASLLSWKGLHVKIFNVGSYRRKAVGARESGMADFFNAENEEAAVLRQKLALEALNDMVHWLVNLGDNDAVAIFDATNTTKSRRDRVLDFCSKAPVPISVVFLESICDDKEVLEANMLNKIKISPDFQGVDLETALVELRQRISNYEKIYETIEDDNLSYIKLYNLSSKLLVNKIYGRLNKSILPALTAWNISTRPLWLVRCGRPVGAVGGSETTPFTVDRNAELHEEGLEFSRRLGEFVRTKCHEWHHANGTSETLDSGKLLCKVMTSTIPRAYHTAVATGLNVRVGQFSHLNPLDKGVMHGVQMHDMRDKDDKWHSEWCREPLLTRFPGGESYLDVVERLEPVVVEMEQQVCPVLLVAHVSVLQVLLSYFTRKPIREVHNIEVPMNTVIELVPTFGGEFISHSYPLMQGSGIPNYRSSQDQSAH